eukprot:6539975-Pyramimonas_sp.AAC.1
MPSRHACPPADLAQHESGSSLPPRCYSSSSFVAVITFTVPVPVISTLLLMKNACFSICFSLLLQLVRYCSDTWSSSSVSSAVAARALLGVPERSGSPFQCPNIWHTAQ